jgi:DnaJ like chaperone protein
MSWWGKLLGGTFGFMLGGPLGALMGAALGHNFDKGLHISDEMGGFQRGDQQRVQTAFFTASFSVMGAVCKADGQVSEDEIAIAKQVMGQMQLTPEQKKAAMALFNEGKKRDFPLVEVIQQLKSEIGFRPNLQRMFLEIQLYAAYADGVMHPDELRLLKHVCEILRFPQKEFQQLDAAIRAQLHHQGSGQAGKPAGISLKDAYTTLNVSKDASNAEVKRAYRRLLSQHHPDKLVSKGLPEEMMKIATDRTHEIRQAYEKIKDTRGI